jgi:MFS family permease
MAGMALPAAVLVARFGCRTTVMVGLGILVAACVSFPLAPNGETLIGARLAQGAGSCTAWGGSLAWIMSETDESRRGRTIGIFFSASFVGALVGPVLGVLAARYGEAPVFGGLAIFAVAVGLAAPRYESLAAQGREGLAVARAAAMRGVRRALRGTGAASGVVVMVTMGVSTGALSVVGPLLLARKGGSTELIGLAFVASYCATVVLSPAVGRAADLWGPGPAAKVATVASALAILALPHLHNLIWATPVFIASLGTTYTLWPSGTLLLGVAAGGRDSGTAGVALAIAGWGIGAAAGAALLPNIGLVYDRSATYIVLSVVLMFSFTVLCLTAGPPVIRSAPQ